MPLGRRYVNYGRASGIKQKRSVRGASSSYRRSYRGAGLYRTRYGSRTRRPATAAARVKAASKSYPTLTGCAALWLKSLYDPFNTVGACMPSGFAISTAKKQYRQYGTMLASANAGNCAWVICNGMLTDPEAGTPTYPQHQPIWYTDGTQGADGITSPQPGAQAPGAATNGIQWLGFPTGYNAVTPTGTNSLFDRVNGIKWRIVSMGIKVWYTGTELDRGGTYTICEQPSHADFTGQNDSNLHAFRSSRQFPIGTDPIHVCLSTPVVPAERELGQPHDEGSNSRRDARESHCLAIYARSATGTASYHFEVVINVEEAGPAVHGMTHADADPLGYAAVCNIVQKDICDDCVRPGNLMGAIGRTGPAMQSLSGVSDATKRTVAQQALANNAAARSAAAAMAQ